MSRSSKVTFTLSCILTAATVIGVHVVQGMERETLHQGPIKDAQRMAAKQQQRVEDVDDSKSRKRLFNIAEHEEQLELRRKYESMQPLSGDIKTREKEGQMNKDE